MPVSINGSGTVTGAKFGKTIQIVNATEKGASTNSGNWYFNYTSTPSYDAGYTVCSATITPVYSGGTGSGNSVLAIYSQGIYGEESDNTDGFGGVGLSYNGGIGSGWISVLMRGRQTYSAYFENIADSGVSCNGSFYGHTAGSAITIYLKIFNNFNSTKVIKTGHVPAVSNVTQSTSLAATGYKSWLRIEEVLL